MDARENTLNCIHFNKPEYIPMCFAIITSCWDSYPKDFLIEQMASHKLLFPDFNESEFVIPEHPITVLAGKPYIDPWGCRWETAIDGIMGVVTKHPLENWDDFENFSPPDPDKTTNWEPIDWESKTPPAVFREELCSADIGHGHTFLKLTDIRGYQNIIFDMADEHPKLYGLIDMIEEFNAKLLCNYLKYFEVEAMGFAEDLGMQNGPMLSPQYFRKYIKLSYQRLMAIARKAGCIINMHSDGDIKSLVGDLTESGVDVINLQDLVNGIDWIKDNLTGKVCVDLDIDRQMITAQGTPEQIDALIREEVEKLGSKNGGLMMIHGLYPGVPLENVKALMDAMERYSTFYS